MSRAILPNLGGVSPAAGMILLGRLRLDLHHTFPRPERTAEGSGSISPLRAIGPPVRIGATWFPVSAGTRGDYRFTMFRFSVLTITALLAGFLECILCGLSLYMDNDH
jgi:hypothetical protein